MTAIEYAYCRFMRVRFSLPTEDQLADVERRINIVFPDDYRRFLLEFNGGYFCEPLITPVGDGCPEDALTYLSGIGASHEYAELGTPWQICLFDNSDSPQIVPIGYTVMGGYIILDTAPGEGRGEIYYKQAFGDFYWIAEGIEAFFALLSEPRVLDE
jgi:hypothetical protein